MEPEEFLTRMTLAQDLITKALARIETNQQEMVPVPDRVSDLQRQVARLEEQQDKDSAQLTEICLILNELLPYARRAAQMMDKNPLVKFRKAMGNAAPRD